MFQTKKITLRVFSLSLCCLMVVTSVFCVPVSAVDYSIVDATDYLTSKNFDGDNVLLEFTLPCNPIFSIYGKKGEADSYKYMGEVPKVNFLQDIENNTTLMETNFLNLMVNFNVSSQMSGTVPSYSDFFFERLADLTSLTLNSLPADYELVQKNDHLYSYDLKVFEAETTNLLISYSFYSDDGNSSASYVATNHTSNRIMSLSLYGTEEVTNVVNTYDYLTFYGYVFGSDTLLDVSDISPGADITLSLDIDYSLIDSGALYVPFYVSVSYWAEDFSRMGQDVFAIDIGDLEPFVLTFTVPSNVEYCSVNVNSRDIDVKQCNKLFFSLDNITMSCSLSAIEESSQTQQKIVKKLDEIDGKIDGVIDGLGSIEDVLEGTNDRLDDVNDKLDDTNDKLDELPGQIGDEMQGVIDKEEQENTSAGQEFVDQILDILPDNSTEIMAALRSLPDAMSYTGTEAVLQIPGIVMPAVGDLIPRTEIWPGAELDFSDYVELLPPSLLNLVRALFTIAIVLFCAYELKGIVSYCLTLKDNGRGA